MLFNSFEFLLFFPLVTILYFVLAQKWRWALLLSASCFFYGFFKIEYLFILAFTIIVDYFAGLWIEKTVGKSRKFALVASIIANVGVLAVFKYADFLIGNANAVLFKLGQETYSTLDILLPIGLSFHTFQAMSYTIEVYRGTLPAERNIGRYALYVMFYPQLVAGPIERPQNVIHQFFEKHTFDFARAKSGLRLMLWGMFKKVVIADRVSIFVDQIYNSPDGYTGLPLLVATIFFGVQIYCDFSGYSDIALGAARVMGFRLMKNFDRPYLSKSISEFWKRWHISLSSWFKDYLYIPMGGNRVSRPRRYFNLFIVFMISGLWHGPSWNFVIWGSLHGFYLIMGQVTGEFQSKVISILKNPFLIKLSHALIVFFFVNIAWVFFRANTTADSFYILSHLFTKSSHSISAIFDLIGYNNLILIVLSITLMETVQWLQRGRSIALWIESKPRWQQWASYYVLLFAVVFFGVYNNTQFIYFQF